MLGITRSSRGVEGTVLSHIINGFISTALVPALIEELAKNVALKLNFPWLYTILFSVLEHVYGYPDESNIATVERVAFHNALTAIQKWGETHDKQRVGFALAVLVHGIWNFLNILIHVNDAMKARRT
jgi:RsiW-degrading membrane proteinase PrsW (M82 family)